MRNVKIETGGAGTLHLATERCALGRLAALERPSTASRIAGQTGFDWDRHHRDRGLVISR
jgi:hypothetical protein